MKKLFFIPAILFVLVSVILISNQEANSKNSYSHYTLIAFREKGTGNPINGVGGCLGGINFNSGAHSYVYLYDVPAGTYGACGQGPYFYSGTDSFVLNGTSQTFWLYMQQDYGMCSCMD